jgi:hypothetical protein
VARMEEIRNANRIVTGKLLRKHQLGRLRKYDNIKMDVSNYK